VATRDEYDARALFDEAVAMYEEAKRAWEELQGELQRSVAQRRLPPRSVTDLEDAARARLLALISNQSLLEPARTRNV
jgi:hypothetical protein